VQADRLRLRQVLLNLVTNAIKYNRPQGRVDVRARQVGQEIEIAAADTGLGLTPEQLARLYQPFDRLGAENGPVEGNGIGLVIARGLVQGMGGRLEVSSQPGQGSVFTVCLPAAVTPPERAASAPPSAPAPARLPAAAQAAHGAPPMQALYVEDNEANVAVVQGLFALRPGWTLAIARDGAQALARLSRERPDLLIVDMHLPDMNGLELARRLDGDAATAGIVRVALSADATAQRSRSAAEHGFERYFTKPLDIQMFLTWLDGLVPRLSAPRA
jgi:CheY-like chemotaxis protein/anti-sigma regulatory factor (Ser/Thr protein kinase)